MARREPSRRRAAPARAKSKTARRSKLTTLVSTLKTRAVALTRRRRSPAASSPPPAPAVAAQKPLPRRSTVRVPPRGPTRRTAKPAARRERRANTRTSVPVSVPGVNRPPAPTPGIPQTGAAAAPSRPGMSHAPSPWSEEQFSIPNGYGDTRITLMVKDPWWLFAYWEVSPQTERSVRSQLLPHEIADLQTVLRVYDVTDVDFPSQPAHHAFDISLSGLASNWYIHTNAPHRSFLVEIGLLTAGGRFLLLARSNCVTAPRFGPSDVIDEEWLTTDEMYWKLFSSAPGAGSSPTAWANLVSQKLFSGAWASPGVAGPGRVLALKGFWCRVDTDLVIHGATEPRSTVAIQGQLVPVRKDGTFSLRLALPPGEQSIAIDVTSPDGQQTRTMTPIVRLAWSGTLSSDPAVGAKSRRPRISS